MSEDNSTRTPTRTLAILAHSACTEHRPNIQAEISSKGFSILSERMEQWSSEDDVDFLHEFFRDPLASSDSDYAKIEKGQWVKSLTDHPIYVMVLERIRAAELWQEMCGDGENGNGIRAQYGIHSLYAPPPRLANRQIAICFPDLATAESLAALQLDTTEMPNTVMAIDSNGAFLVREDADIVYDEQGQAFDAHNGEPLELQQELNIAKEALPGTSSDDSKLGSSRIFKARPLPATHKKASAQPRLSRAAALRMGVALPEPPKRATSTISSEDVSNKGISGLPKANVAVPKSLQAPTIAPRMNRSAAARTGAGTGGAGTSEPSAGLRDRKPVDFSKTPGHKRVSKGDFKLASLAAPTVAPRLNKAAAARTSGISSSTSTQFSQIRAGRSSSITSGTSSNPRSGINSNTPADSSIARKPIDFSNTPGHKRASMSTSTLKSLMAPSIVPRGNRASLARVGGAQVGEEQASTNSIGAKAVSKGGAEMKKVENDEQKVRSLKPPVVVTKSSGKENRSGHNSVASSRDAVAAIASRERKPVDFSNTPGHKRTSQSISNIASLAQPTIKPRLNTAAQKRLSVGPGSGTLVNNSRHEIRGGQAPPSSFRV